MDETTLFTAFIDSINNGNGYPNVPIVTFGLVILSAFVLRSITSTTKTIVYYAASIIVILVAALLILWLGETKFKTVMVYVTKLLGIPWDITEDNNKENEQTDESHPKLTALKMLWHKLAERSANGRQGK